MVGGGEAGEEWEAKYCNWDFGTDEERVLRVVPLLLGGFLNFQR